MNSEQITAFLQEHWYIASVLIGAVILIGEMCIRDRDQSKHRLKKLIQNANDSIVISHSADVSSYKKRNYYMVEMCIRDRSTASRTGRRCASAGAGTGLYGI